MKDLTIVKEIYGQLTKMYPQKVMSWGAHKFQYVNETTIQFSVNGHHFKGQIRIELDCGMDLYNIHYGHFKNFSWQNIETQEGIYMDQVHELIDKKIEWIEQYKD